MSSCHEDQHLTHSHRYGLITARSARFGAHWGVIGLLVGSFAQAFCLPLDARLHQGFAHLRQEEPLAAGKDTLCSRLLAMALQFALRQDTPAILVTVRAARQVLRVEEATLLREWGLEKLQASA